LKAIEIIKSGGEDKNFISEILPSWSETHQRIWKERMSYFKQRGICVTNKREICRNKVLQKQLAKKAGVTWRFDFW